MPFISSGDICIALLITAHAIHLGECSDRQHLTSGATGTIIESRESPIFNLTHNVSGSCLLMLQRHCSLEQTQRATACETCVSMQEAGCEGVPLEKLLRAFCGQGARKLNLTSEGILGYNFITSHRGYSIQMERNGTIYLGNTYGDEAKWFVTEAGNGRVFLTSHFGAQLANVAGKITVSNKHDESEEWYVANAGEGRVELVSYLSTRLADDGKKIVLSSDTGIDAMWVFQSCNP